MLLQICLIIYSIYYYQTKIKKQNLKLTTKSKIFLGIAIFCTTGSFAMSTVEIEDEYVLPLASSMYSILASIFYVLFIINSKRITNNANDLQIFDKNDLLDEKEQEIKNKKKIKQ